MGLFNWVFGLPNSSGIDASVDTTCACPSVNTNGVPMLHSSEQGAGCSIVDVHGNVYGATDDIASPIIDIGFDSVNSFDSSSSIDDSFSSMDDGFSSFDDDW